MVQVDAPLPTLGLPGLWAWCADDANALPVRGLECAATNAMTQDAGVGDGEDIHRALGPGHVEEMPPLLWHHTVVRSAFTPRAYAHVMQSKSTLAYRLPRQCRLGLGQPST